MRSREMGSRMYGLFQKAATADGADKSGLTALTYPVMANFAVDAAMAVALANTLFFAAATAESKSKVALYLLITIAPFAVIAPLIGPALDRLQHGRRAALAASFGLRTLLAVIMIANYDGASGSFPPWVLYPCALSMLVLSKSFGVLRGAVTPRVLPRPSTWCVSTRGSPPLAWSAEPLSVGPSRPVASSRSPGYCTCPVRFSWSSRSPRWVPGPRCASPSGWR